MLNKAIHTIIIISMFIVLVNCKGNKDEKKENNASASQSTSEGASSTRLINTTYLRFTSESIQYVKDGQKDVMMLKVEGCTDNLKYRLSRGDWKVFDIDSDTGEITFKKEPDFKIKKEYKFTAIAESCIDERDDLNVTVIVREEQDTTPVTTPTSIETSTPIATSSPRDEIKESDYFITKWKTDENGSSGNHQIIIPVTQYKDYNFSISWGDGTFNSEVTQDITHTYEDIGIYTIKIFGDFPQMVSYESRYDNNISINIGDHGKLLSIEQWGTIKWESMNNAFIGCSNMIGNFTDTPDLSNVTDMSGMFYGAKKFNSSIDSWDVSNIIYMNGMFAGAEKFNKNISSWDTSNVLSMSEMFYGAKLFNQDISSWNVSKVTSMEHMFAGAENFNQPIGNWDVSKVKNMSGLFSFASSFNQTLNSWDVSSVTNMSSMFFGGVGASSSFSSSSYPINLPTLISKHIMLFNQDISGWNVSNVINMSWMFCSAEKFNKDISSWDVSNVTNMSIMFSGAKSFSNHDLSTWDVSNVTSHDGFSSSWGTGNTEPNWQQ